MSTLWSSRCQVTVSCLCLCLTDAVRSGLPSHQPVLLHGKVWLPGSHLDPPHLDVRRLLLPPLLQLLDTGLHQGQEAADDADDGGQAENEWLDQRACLHGGQWETLGERARQPPHERQSPPGQSKRNLTFWLWTRDEGLDVSGHKLIITLEVSTCNLNLNDTISI